MQIFLYFVYFLTLSKDMLELFITTINWKIWFIYNHIAKYTPYGDISLTRKEIMR